MHETYEGDYDVPGNHVAQYNTNIFTVSAFGGIHISPHCDKLYPDLIDNRSEYHVLSFVEVSVLIGVVRVTSPIEISTTFTNFLLVNRD